MNTGGNLREKALGCWGRWASIHWGKTLLIGLAVTAVMTLGVSRLDLEMTFFSVMPGNSSQVRDLKRIMKEFPYASGITVVVDGRMIDDPAKAGEQIRAAVDGIAAELEKAEYGDYVKDVHGRYENDFLLDHGFMLSDGDDRERFERIFADLNLTPFLAGLNDDLEREYSGNEENLADDEIQAVSQFEGLGRLFSLMEEAAGGHIPERPEVDGVLDAFLVGESYFLSRDGRMALVMVQPTFTMEDLPMLVPGVNLIEETAREIAGEFGVEAGCTGITTIGRDEMVTSEQGLAASMLIAFFLILVLMILVFRMFSTPVITGLPLLVGIYWAMGMTGFTIHRLNIMTAMYMVALIGLGIDFAIHLLTAYRQERDGIGGGAADFHDAVAAAFSKTGPGILTGALTTAIAFFAMLTAETELMRELGIVAGLGILFELAAMILFIPALMGLRESRLRQKGREEKSIFRRMNIRSDLASGLGKRVIARPGTAVGAMLILTAILLLKAGDVEIENNLLNMEARGLESVELQDTLVEEFEMGADGLFILSNDLEEVKTLEKKLKKLDSVKQVDSIGPFLLTPEERRERLPGVERFRQELAYRTVDAVVDGPSLFDELIRLQMNLLELSDMAYLGDMEKMLNTLNGVTGWNSEGDKAAETSLDRLLALLENGEGTEGLAELQNLLVPLLRDKLRRMASTDDFTRDDLPALYRNSYISPETGEFLMTIVPTRNPWEGDFREIYLTQIGSVTDRGTGMILASDQLTIMAESDGFRASLAALAAIFIVLLMDFRNLKLVLLTMSPLGLSFLCLFGFMGWTGIKFDFVNIIAVPLLIGMGVDDAVHISHRYLLEGKGRLPEVIAATGTAVMLTSVTTVIAFASFIPSVMRAMRSTGIVLSIAMAFAFFFAIIFYSALLKLVADGSRMNLTPWRKK